MNFLEEVKSKDKQLKFYIENLVKTQEEIKRNFIDLKKTNENEQENSGN